MTTIHEYDQNSHDKIFIPVGEVIYMPGEVYNIFPLPASTITI